MMNERRAWWFLGFLILLPIGCGGGSGSSGFDARALEEQAIARALREQSCIRLQATGQVICPLGAQSPANATGEVVVRAPMGAALTCVQGAADCSLVFVLDVGPLASGYSVGIAVRRPDQVRPWHVVLEPRMLVAAGQVELEAEISASEVLSEGGPVPLQVAVLLFAGPPPAVPERVGALAETGAEIVFVGAPLLPAPAGFVSESSDGSDRGSGR
ncbi:MAG: hypothetical protein KatS3mg077_2947 [Candidatus Binatia bacterium]|nr:MAG: hypothetical protein KatS3mg077_2947 [Candidatus Binatia bacterium]